MRGLFLAALLFLGTASMAQDGHEMFTGQAAVADPAGERSLIRFPCHTCHGRDGQGGIEGDVPPIEWSRLSVASADRPGYGADTFHRAVTEGIAVDGRPLSRLMPRYALNRAETDTLRAYLGRLHEIQRRGVLSDRLRIGVATIPGAAEISDGYRAALAKSLSERLGGDRVYGRQIELVPVDATQPGEAHDLLAVIGLPVAAVNPFTQLGLPVLAPVGALSGNEDSSILRGITPSRDALHAALAAEVATKGQRPILVVSQDPAQRSAFALALSLAAPDRAQTDHAKEAEDIVVLDASPLPQNSAARVWITWQSLAARSTTAAPDQTIMVAIETPRIVSDAITAQTHPIQIHAQEAGAVLAEALKAAGRDVTRARLLRALGDTVLVDIGLDYARFPLTGTEEIAVVPMP
ncbi:hypothetical protein ROSMUCSMR3_02114 [Roseovarius mucosus]|uniref:Cytochrome c domain-containing protein n=1 Tax=Roseovarius mucosus TaxID=215743 RepID=A0A1V0RP75_9RHOB|nr:hypothetical protein [Roseovarius mucosus]ARE83588.1 hypothetical protein ROSMUCSMR3_02114 [Roseovarius mucosus]